MTDSFHAIEDADNMGRLLLHHLGNPWIADDDGNPMSAVALPVYLALKEDLLRYCTRLRCQPNTEAHEEVSGGHRYQVPAHQLIGRPPRHAKDA